MTKTELNRFRNILEAKLAELTTVVRQREGIEIERTADALDEVGYAAERELVTRNLNRDSDTLRKVRAALRRIDEGVFGICLQCEEDLSPKRLTSIPWTAYCITCQVSKDDLGLEEEPLEIPENHNGIPHTLQDHKASPEREKTPEPEETVFDRYCPRYRVAS